MDDDDDDDGADLKWLLNDDVDVVPVSRAGEREKENGQKNMDFNWNRIMIVRLLFTLANQQQPNHPLRESSPTSSLYRAEYTRRINNVTQEQWISLDELKES